MSTYERQAWEQSLRRLQAAPRSLPIPQNVRDSVTKASHGASSFADQHLKAAAVKEIVEQAMAGTLELTFNPALRSVSVDSALRGYQKLDEAINDLDDLRKLDLVHLDRFRRRKGAYVASSAAQGAATSLVVTGMVVSTTVSAGATAGAAIAAVAVDTVASLAMMGRSVGSVAARYGYDVRLPDEELFAMGVLSLGVAASMEAKHAALFSLSRLTQQMMRQATWKQLHEHVLVKVINRIYVSLGVKLTKEKLAQVVPFVGVGINATLSASMTKRAYERAEDAYRLRFLTEKYGLDPATWSPAPFTAPDALPTAAGVPDITAMLEEEQRTDDQ